MRRLIVATLVLALGMTALAHAAPVRVQAGHSVSEIKAVGSDVRIDGRVGKRVIVIDGDLIVGPHGSVTDPIVLGGQLNARPGSQVRGQIVTVGWSWPRLSTPEVLLLLLAIMLLRAVVAWIIVRTAQLLLSRPLTTRLQDVVSARPLRVLSVGALAASGLGASALLLMLSVLGAPMALALLGLLVAATVLGVSLVLAQTDDGRHASRLALVALTIPLAGDALAALAAILGLGAALRLWGTGARSASPATQPAPVA